MLRSILLSLSLIFSAAFASAQDGSNDAIEDVISNQMQAFQSGDVETAFGYAAPGIQSMFGSPQNFGLMVERGYPMVWQPDDVRFGELRTIDGRLRQKVIVTDQVGAIHVLDYEMIEIAGQWRIGGVQILEAPEVSA